MLHTLAQALEEVGRIKATCDRRSQVTTGNYSIKSTTYPPRLAVPICG